MYCPRCNLHSEEYVEKCPLCDGSMEVDAVGSGVMKTPTIPEKEEHTGDLPREETLELTEEEVEEETTPGATVALEQEQTAAEAGRETLRMEALEEREEGSAISREDRLDQQELIPVTERSGHKRFPLIVGGGILVVLVAGVLGYFFSLPPEKTSPPKMKRVVAAKKKAALRETSALKKTLPAKKPKEVPETTITEAAKGEGALEAKKAGLAPSESIEKSGGVKKTEVLEQVLEPAAKGAPAAKPPPATSVLTLKRVFPEKPEIAVPPLPSANVQGHYSVHVGSFKEKEPADYLKDKLQNKGYPVMCNLVSIPGKGDWYRVKVGYYSSLKDAQQVASKLKIEERVFTLILKK